MIDKVCFYIIWVLYDMSVLLPLFFYVHTVYSGRKYTAGCLKGMSAACLAIYLLLSVIAYITPDFPSYQEIIDIIYRSNGTEYTHLEEVWVKLVLAVEGNIFAFRLVLFFFTFILLYKIGFFLIDRSENIFLFFLFYAVFCLYKTISGREYLALLLFFYGVCLLYRRKKITAVIFLILSVFLHKAAFIYFLPLLPTGFKLTKRRLKLLLAIGLPLGIIVSHVLYRYVESNAIFFPGWTYFTDEYLVEVSSIWKWLGYIQVVSIAGFATAELILLLRADRLPFPLERIKRYLFYSLYIVVGVAASPIPGVVAGRFLSSFFLFPMVLLAPYCWQALSNRDYKWFFGSITFLFYILTNVYIAGISNRY